MRLTPFLPTWRSEGESEPRIGRRPHGRRPRLTAQQEQPECRDHSVTGQASPWYSPSRPNPEGIGALRRSNGPATCVWLHDPPPSSECANQTSVVSGRSPERSLRWSYQRTPTVPCLSTAIAGSNANAVTPGKGVGPVQVSPPSRDVATSIVPEVAELGRSQAM